MPVVINLVFWGDKWINHDDTTTQLYNIPANETVLLHTQHEGISLRSSGVLEVIDKWVIGTNRNPNSVQIHTPNQIEKIPYKFSNVLNKYPHFFNPKQLKYNQSYTSIDPSAQLFGFFIGRYNSIRNAIARDIIDSYRQYFLMSVMNADRLETKYWWDPDIEAIGSIDNTSINDQYNSIKSTNQSLLQFYSKFQIELAIETVTQGESFFPTEKTIRPIMGSKPFLVYATVGFLQNFRNLGFRTFSELWSEEYDQHDGLTRWHKIKEVIDQIIEQGYDCNLANNIVKYNHEHLQTIKHSDWT